MIQKIKNRLKDQRGLTLIELLAVIVILGIIAAIAVPSIMNVIDNSKEDAVRADAIQVLNAANLYIAAEGYPSGGLDNASASNEIAKLQEYVDNVDLSGITKIESVPVASGVGNELKITGSIRKDSKTLNFSAATLKGIEGVEFTNNAATANE